ncbi:MAG: alcohol dehydrogenase catalytic domain-containing protein [Actinobacteria bacterium]|uniref:Unannotated protein n=1 Tax=freshwater metagenome TaxID=449393 RepID=A0A6J7GD96_9ZZZZ|nr:alcohol dehydrogenase catalytic domain-containing protein [Actinomycetota bacterium]
MRAVVLHGPEKLSVDTVADPKILAPTDAIVRVTHSAICGADLHPYHGHAPGFESGTVLGHEFVGTVVERGAAVTSVEIGQRVVNTSMTSDGSCIHCRAGRFTQCDDRSLFGYSGIYPRLDGGQADFVRVPMANRSLFAVPDGVSSNDAVFVADILPTGFAAVQRSGATNADVVVVLGCGPVGLMAVMCAVGPARAVVAVDGIAVRRELAEKLGAQSVTPEAAADLVNNLTHGLGADAVIEASGSPHALQAAFGLTRAQGVISVVGAHFEPDFPIDNGVMFAKELSLVFSIGNPTRDREKLMDAVLAGKFTPSQILTHSISIDDAVHAYERFDAKEMTKVILTTE